MVWATHMRKGKETQVLNIIMVVIWCLFECGLVWLEICTAPQMIPDRKCSPDRKWSPNWTANDPEPKVIPHVDRKWSRRKTRNGIEFGFLDFFNVLFYFYIPLTNRVRGPYSKLRTEFFPLWFMAQVRSARAINRRGKTRIRNLQYGPRKQG